MKFQAGDIVRYLNDVGGGVVSRIVNSSTVEIIDESGFTLPVRENELVLIERPEKKNEVNNTSVQIMPEEILNTDDLEDEDIEGNDSPHLFLAFIRNAKKSNLFEAYVINDCNYHTLYVLSSREENLLNRISSGMLEANSKLLIAEFEYESLTKMEKLHFQGIFFKNRNFESQKNVDIEIAINPVKFYKPGVFVVNDFFDEDAYVIDFYDALKIRESEEKKLLNVEPEKIQEAIQEKQDLKKNEVKEIKKTEKFKEVDLHILELVDDDSKMSPLEKLEMQMKVFESELAKAISEGYEKIVFIHGVGQGILKAKIRGCLDKDYPQFFYQDASFQKYKFGATLVYLKKIYK
ncbi:MAG: DUF2027 domain-containing protein [Bacteroidales bacterium]|nr:DUF2027 domain-containing protein [Bacteroidales bacterium]